MPKLRILAAGQSANSRSNKRGKMFENLMTSVLKQVGYKGNHIASTNYGGMEIDIEGEHVVTGQGLVAECKFYESEIDAPKLQAFFGKYMAKWIKNKHVQGLFIAIPGVNSHAKAFYNDTCLAENQFSLRLLEEEAVIGALISSGAIADATCYAGSIPKNHGTAGEWNALVTEFGIVIVQWVVPNGSVVPSHIALLSAKGEPLTDTAVVEQILDLEPELRAYELLSFGGSPVFAGHGGIEIDETVVEIKGGSECFEFQFPASPEHFIGRTDLLEEVKGLVSKIGNQTTSARGLLFEANSGWGKSSCVLACAQWLKDNGHFAVAIDSRSASSSQFVFRMVEHVAGLFVTDELTRHFIAGTKISGHDGAAKLLVRIGEQLRQEGKVGFIFLDQFENVFFQPDVFKRIRDLFLKVSSADTNIAFGFCWKTDLVGLTNDFPYQIRDSIRSACRVIPLTRFSEAETNGLLDRLAQEIRSKLRTDLRFFLSEFSQGYPWLLKKLALQLFEWDCAQAGSMLSLPQ